MEQLYTLTQVCEVLQISRRTAQRLLAQGKLKGHKVGRIWRFSKTDIDEYLELARQ